VRVLVLRLVVPLTLFVLVILSAHATAQ